MGFQYYMALLAVRLHTLVSGILKFYSCQRYLFTNVYLYILSHICIGQTDK